MQPIPVKVKNVTVYAYFPNQPLIEEVITGASGTYSVGTLLTSVFYNLDLTNGGTRKNPLVVHGKYYATGETESGEKFTTPWMYCTNNSDQPEFGRTIKLAASNADAANVSLPMGDESGFIKLGPLTDITVSQEFPPPAIGQRTLITNGNGYIIATKIGTPHEMGVQVDSGDRLGQIVVGSKGVIITGTTQDGRRFSQVGLTVVSGGQPAIFLKEFPQ